MKQKRVVIAYLTLSAISVALIVVILWLDSTEGMNIPIYDRIFVGGAFILVCLFGISLAVKPNWTRRLTRRGAHNVNEHRTQKNTRKRQGHHPDCEPFEEHTIKIGKKAHCAGCTGLAMGSVIAIFLTTIYFIISKNISYSIFFIFVILGMILIALSFFEIVISLRKGSLHLVSNVLLVVGFFFVIIGLFQVTGKTVYGLIAVVISFLWLDTRIQLSDWNHVRVCKDCGEPCKVYHG